MLTIEAYKNAHTHTHTHAHIHYMCYTCSNTNTHKHHSNINIQHNHHHHHHHTIITIITKKKAQCSAKAPPYFGGCCQLIHKPIAPQYTPLHSNCSIHRTRISYCSIRQCEQELPLVLIKSSTESISQRLHPGLGWI